MIPILMTEQQIDDLESGTPQVVDGVMIETNKCKNGVAARVDAILTLNPDDLIKLKKGEPLTSGTKYSRYILAKA